MNIQDMLEKKDLEKEDIVKILAVKDKGDLELIRAKAMEVLDKNCGTKVYYRGLLEFSNICVNDCFYCGIRKSNKQVKRFFLKKDDIVKIAKWCSKQGYGSIVLQSGERRGKKFIEFIIDVLEAIKAATKSKKLPQGLGITLCVGEQSRKTYERFFKAGAHRYLLRVETTSPTLFKKIHPSKQTLEKRKKCLRILKEIGYQVGTGVMVGLPGQTLKDLANDILFFKEFDIDMIGMGPYIIHEQTPMKKYKAEMVKRKQEVFNLCLKMIAATRLVLKDVNIAATTALQALDPLGREKGLEFGANIIMPLVTPGEVRKDYQLYEGKPCLDEQSADCRDCLLNRIKSIKRTVGFNEWGDSSHFFNRTQI